MGPPFHGLGIEKEMQWIRPCPTATTHPSSIWVRRLIEFRAAENSWLGEIADQLESDPQECWQAFESLATVEPELRLSIIDELSRLGDRPGALMLLRLLSSARDSATRAGARSALERMDGEAHSAFPIAPPPHFGGDPETGIGGSGRRRWSVPARAGARTTFWAAFDSLPGHPGGRRGPRVDRRLGQPERPAPNCRVPVRREAGNLRRCG